MGWIIALAIIFLLAIMPLGVSVLYDSGGPLVRVVAGPIKLKVFPGKKKDPDAPPKPKKEKKKKTPAKDSGGKQTGQKVKKKSGGPISDFFPFVTLVLDFLLDFRNKLRINCLELKLIMAGGDPADLAINYGKAWAAVGNLWPRLETWFVIKKRNVEVECDFEGSETTVFARLDLTITLGRILSLVVRYAIRGLKEFLNFRKKRKGGITV
jgi:hypothetical protein